jgi:hypothetical protein
MNALQRYGVLFIPAESVEGCVALVATSVHV